jgi:hypothetical protein
MAEPSAPSEGMQSSPPLPAEQTPVPSESSAPAPQPEVPVEKEAIPVTSTPASEADAETAKVPDTDEFLKSILEDHPQPSQEAPATSQVNEPPASDMPAPEAPPEQFVPMDQANEMPSQPSEFPTAPAPTLQPDAQPAPAEPSSMGGASGFDKTDMSSVDGISSAPPEQPTIPVENSDQQMPDVKPAASPTKLIILIVVAAILVIGGYLAYTMLFSTKKSTDNSSGTTATATSTASAFADDESRKLDLIDIQQALLNYYAGTGQYPIASTMIYLNTAGNVVEKALVPAYFAALPTDPASPTKNYAYKSDGKTFSLTSVLDNAADPDGVPEAGLTLYKVTQATVSDTDGSVSTVSSTATVESTTGAIATKTATTTK